MRIALRLAALVLWLLICVPAYLVSRLFTRRKIVPHLFLGGVARIAGVRIARRGSLAGPRAILLANHLSWLDIPLLAGTAGSAFVAHDGLAGSRFLKWLCDMNDTVFIARNRRTTVAGQVDQVRDALDMSPVLTLFPEGTTGDGHALLPLKSALLSAIDPAPEGVSIQPVYLSYGPETPDIAWVGSEHGLDNFLKILGRSAPIEATVHFLPELTGPQIANRKTIAAATRAELEHARNAR